jgi:putative ATP-binding cassette transporter
MSSEVRRFASAAVALAWPFWVSKERWRARGLLAAIVSLTLGLVYVNVLFSNWNNRFYDALQLHDFSAFLRELGYFCGLATAFIVIAVYQTYLSQMLEIRWRRWLTDQYLDDWLQGHAHFHLQVSGHKSDNPDQRIADDLRLFVEATLSLSLGLLSSAVTLASFASILWRLSGTLVIPLGTSHVALPGYLLWAGLIYAVVGTWLTHVIGRPLIRLNFQQQQFEANFRFSLVRLRENAEGIALYAGEREETRSLGERFADVVANWWGIMRRQKRLTWFTAGYSQVAIVFPILAAAPRYFSRAVQLGVLMQTAQAFGQVQSALSWFVTAYTQLAQWKATTDRLTTFRTALASARAQAAASEITWRRSAHSGISTRELQLALPSGAALLAVPDTEVGAGETLLVTGRTGVGKSTLLRAIAGIWPFGRGTIDTPRREDMLFLPQRPYLPVGPLRSVLTYPQPPSELDDGAVCEAMTACGLAHLAPRLDEAGNWALSLSPGEQQRNAFARALLQRPRWLFLDEATSALDEETETRLYELVKRRLPETAIISIGHRSALAAFHDRSVELGGDAEAGRAEGCNVPRAPAEVGGTFA